ncbi:hypothetical protein SB764_42690, partial [Paraburkholderia sp. SIMBA_027]
MVDVMDHLDDGRSARQEQGGEKRDPVLAVNNGIVIRSAAEHLERCLAVNRQGASPAQYPDPVDDVLRSLARVTPGKPRNL